MLIAISHITKASLEAESRHWISMAEDVEQKRDAELLRLASLMPAWRRKRYWAK